MLTPNLFNTALVFPIINTLLLFYQIFLFLKIPFAFGFSIVCLTVLIRLLLHPFFHRQTMMAKKMEKIKPQLDHLSKKHKDDKKKLQEEQMRLYKEMGINPASGCLFAIIQIPIFIGLYNVLSLFLLNGGVTKIISEVNKIVYFDFLKITAKIDPYFFGLNLGVAPSHYQKYGFYYLLIPLITAFLQYYQVVLSTPKPPPAPKVKEEPAKKEEGQNMQKMMSTQMKFLFPLMIGWFSYTLPVGLSLYWNIFSLFSIAQYKKKLDV